MIKWSDLDFRAWRLKYAKDLNIKKIVGLDTETYRGQAFLLCDSLGNAFTIDSFQDGMNALHIGHRNQTLNLFFNIRYDVNSILSYLPRELITQLHTTNMLNVGGYKIFYLPRKFLKIRKDGLTTSFFDAYPFASSSLDKAALRYLGKRKDDMNS